MDKSGMKEFKFGWPVVGSSAIGIGLGLSPLPFYTIGVFVGPLMKEFGWDVGQIMMGVTMLSVAVLFAAPTVGYITDRIGPRKMVLIAVTTFGLSFMAFALNNGSTALYLTLWALLAFMGAGTLPITWTKAINAWFTRKRGLALGFSLVGTGLFGYVAKMYAYWLIEHFGWRMAYIGLALLPLLIALPLAFFFFRMTDDPKVANKVARMRDELSDEDGQMETKMQEGSQLNEALRDYRFWLLAISFLAVSLPIGGTIPNFETLFSSKGFSAGQAVTLAGVVGYSVVVGRLVGGYLLDRLWAPAVAFVIFLIPVLACFMLRTDAMTFGYAAMATAVIGIAAGVEFDLMAFITSKYFGMKNYGSIYGVLYAFFGIGAGFGPWIFGESFDATGSYNTILLYSAIAFVVGSIPLLFLGKYRFE